MSASVGPQSGPRPPTVPVPMPDMPDLSHLTEEERKIIMAVMVRQREEEDKEEAMLKTYIVMADFKTLLQEASERYDSSVSDHDSDCVSNRQTAEITGLWRSKPLIRHRRIITL
ncbi:Regulating synaptic membrane exocytosis protein 2 [Anabarilius grahami]|uniref:Regulating synaptic membrane exocytosis protein 2 n=1 Tax=Anabarilius grahami TaxID=495550 RepID=A0A3N0YWD0_ANAGA|nr:Regulating synaptic membrane exocytosis protein 2 [Anabarilius grahami]